MTATSNDSAQQLRQPQFLSFPDARQFARAQRLPTYRRWRAWAASASRPTDVPCNPDVVYRAEGWVNWYDWLGTKPQAHRDFSETRSFVRSLKLKSYREWLTWLRGERLDLPSRPEDVPSNPYLVYAERGWDGWGDFLGTGRRTRAQRGRWRPFKHARAYVRKLGLTGRDDYRYWAGGHYADVVERPGDIPAHPQAVYRGAWSGWEDFLGSGHG